MQCFVAFDLLDSHRSSNQKAGTFAPALYSESHVRPLEPIKLALRDHKDLESTTPLRRDLGQPQCSQLATFDSPADRIAAHPIPMSDFAY
jgi:hypothetical protein